MTKSYGKIYQNKSNVSITPFDIYNLYPVGSIYMSVNSTNPSNYFGGTWEQIKDRFLLACGSTYSNGVTGGEATHKLTVEEIPAHSHYIKSYRGGAQWSVGYLWSRAAADAGNAEGGQSNYTYDTGGSKAHNNMPPYLAVYIWKRVA